MIHYITKGILTIILRNIPWLSIYVDNIGYNWTWMTRVITIFTAFTSQKAFVNFELKLHTPTNLLFT